MNTREIPSQSGCDMKVGDPTCRLCQNQDVIREIRKQFPDILTITGKSVSETRRQAYEDQVNNFLSSQHIEVCKTMESHVRNLMYAILMDHSNDMKDVGDDLEKMINLLNKVGAFPKTVRTIFSKKNNKSTTVTTPVNPGIGVQQKNGETDWIHSWNYQPGEVNLDPLFHLRPIQEIVNL